MRLHWFLKFLIILVVLIFSWGVLGYLVPYILPLENISNRDISGIIYRNQKWSGTVKVKGDLATLPGVTVTLDPGTKVLVAISGDRFNFDILPWHLKSGFNSGEEERGVKKGEPYWNEKEKIQLHFSRLIGLGTKQQPIRIASDSRFGSPYDFNIIAIKSGILVNAEISDYRRFEVGEEVVIRDSIIGNTGECSVCITKGKPVILGNRFENSIRENIWVNFASPRITDNIFLNTIGEGIKIDTGEEGVPIISHNEFEMPGKTAIDIVSGGEEGSGVISFNRFSGGSTIRMACNTKITISENHLESRIFWRSGDCSGSYTFGPNFWQTSDKETIFRERMLNKEKDFQVLIPYILDKPSKEVGVR